MKPAVQSFNSWFASNYHRMHNKRWLYRDEDAFHQAYLIARMVLLFGKSVEGTDFEAIFYGCYKKEFARECYNEGSYVHPDELFFEFLSDEGQLPDDEQPADIDKLAKDILSFVRRNFSEKDYRLFRLKNEARKCTFKDLSDYAGTSRREVSEKVRAIENAVRTRSDFRERYACANF